MGLIGFADNSQDIQLIQQNARLIDLLTAQLTAQPGIELVERSAIDKLLREQSLSLAQGVPMDQTLQAGKILKADRLVLGRVLTSPTHRTLLAKIVDAKTGVIRDVRLYNIGDDGLVPLADGLAAFVLASQNAPPNGKRLTYLAVGAFENVSLVQRHSGFGDALRTTLHSRFHKDNVAVVERSMIEPLLHELRWGFMAQEQPDGTPSAAQPAFVLVDGIYQTFQDETTKLNLILRVERLGGGSRRIAFNEPTGEVLQDKIEAAIHAILKEPAEPVVSREFEAQAQLARGMELTRIRKFPDGQISLPMSERLDSAQFGQPRKTLLAEGIKAFQSALFLDPHNEDAKFSLAVCHADSEINEPMEAISYLQEIIGRSTNAMLVMQSRSILANFEADRNPAKARETYLALWDRAATAAERKYYDTPLNSHFDRDYERGIVTREALLDWRNRRWRNQIQAAVESPAAIARGSLHVYGLFQQSMREFLWLFNGDPKGLRAHMDPLLIQVESDYPDLKHFLISGYMALFGGDVPPDILAKYIESLGWCEKYPDQIPYAPSYFGECLRDDLFAHLGHNRMELYFHAAALMEDHGLSHLDRESRDDFLFRLGWTRRERKEFDKAAEVFDRIGNREVRARTSGPWGRLGFYNGSVLARECRLLADGKNPELDGPPSQWLGPPVLSLNSSSLLLCDGPRLWLALDSGLHEYSRDTLKPVSSNLPRVPPGTISTMGATDRHLWLGTQGSGLIRMDKQNGAIRLYTMKENLLQDHIALIHVMPDKVWIGFGNLESGPALGGLGYLDLESDRFIAIMGELNPQLAERPLSGAFSRRLTASNAPTRSVIRGFIQREPDHIQILADGRLHRYTTKARQWAIGTELPAFYSFACNDRFLVGTRLSANSRTPSGQGPFGAVSIRDESTGQWKAINRVDGLPNISVKAAAIDGNLGWIGGEGFLAKINLESGTVQSVYTLQEPELFVRQLAFNGNDLWINASVNRNLIHSLRVYPGSTESRLYKLPLNP